MMAITNLTSSAIRARLFEIASEEKAHAAREMDAEIAALFKEGGDVDALETAQLEAERLSRRLRVERVALEAELPIALKRENTAAVASLAAQHAELAQKAPERITMLETTWQAFRQELEAWEQLQADAVELTEQAIRAATAVDIRAPNLGNFISMRVCSIAVEAQYLSNRLAHAESGSQIAGQYHGHRCD